MDLEQLEGWAAQLLGIEQDTESDVESVFQPILNRLFGFGVAFWPGDDATLDEQQEALERLNVDELVEAVPRARRAIKRGATRALSHGLDVALAEAEIAGADVTPDALPPATRHVSADIHARVDALEVVMRSKVAKTKILLRHATTQSDVLESLAVANQGVNYAKQVARQSTNEASNDALTTVSHTVDVVVSVWRAERDACVHCLAYQGEIDNGKGYPAGLTFGDKPLDNKKVPKPPLHPNCRCTQSLVHKEVVNPLAKSLKREAKRSVLRGWSRPSESEKVRLEAAKRLVQSGNTLPKSVNAYAEAAIKRGEFARGRTPPA
jgi:hypothetical protein